MNRRWKKNFFKLFKLPGLFAAQAGRSNLAREQWIKDGAAEDTGSLGRYSKTSLGTLPRPIGVVRASICVSVARRTGGGVVLGCPDMSPPPNLLIRGGASRLEKEHASQSVFIQRMGRCVAVWREWQRVHTIGQCEPSLAPFVTRKERVHGWYSSERLVGGVSCACVGPRTR